VAFGVVDAALSAAEIATFDASIVAGSYTPPAGSLDYLLEAGDADATWVPSTGSGTLALQGSALTKASITPTWAS
jgi:hypothetical protein